MKKIFFVLLICLFLFGCGNDVTVLPQDHASAVSSCVNNDGVKSYEYHQSLWNGNGIKVECNDGASFRLSFKKIMTQYKDGNGGTYERWKSYNDYTWEIVK